MPRTFNSARHDRLVTKADAAPEHALDCRVPPPGAVMPPDTVAQPDLVIRDAFLIDGSGTPGVRGDLAVKDDRIVAIGDLAKLKGAREIQANGFALAPGFVDTHTHDDRALLSNPLMECKISQGVTTVITGNCGISLAPLSIDRYPPPPLDIIGREPKQF